jgi:hypothetical protein
MTCDPCKDEQLQNIADYLKKPGTQEEITNILHDLFLTEGRDIQDDVNSLLTANIEAFASACQSDAPFHPSSAGGTPSVINPTIVAIVCSAIVLFACVGSGTLFLMLMRRRQVMSLKDDGDDAFDGTPLLDATMHGNDDSPLHGRTHSAEDSSLDASEIHGYGKSSSKAERQRRRSRKRDSTLEKEEHERSETARDDYSELFT